MASFSMSKRINAPVDRVFGIFTDFEHAADRIRGIQRLELLTNGPIGVGTRFRETRMMFKREATEEMEITAFEPGSSYAFGGNSCGSEFSTRFRFKPDAGGTRVDVDMQFRPVSLFAKIMSPLMGWMMGPSMRKAFDQDMEDLKAVAEGAA
jgi:carbon monoxide dehydrogenase subunit G